MKKKKRTEEETKKLIHRLNRIEGQVRGVKKMVEADAYCPDILIQVSAINAALVSFNKALLESHIRTCVVEGVKEDDPEVLDTLMETINRLVR